MRSSQTTKAARYVALKCSWQERSFQATRYGSCRLSPRRNASMTLNRRKAETTDVGAMSRIERWGASRIRATCGVTQARGCGRRRRKHELQLRHYGFSTLFFCDFPARFRDRFPDVGRGAVHIFPVRIEYAHLKSPSVRKDDLQGSPVGREPSGCDYPKQTRRRAT